MIYISAVRTRSNLQGCTWIMQGENSTGWNHWKKVNEVPLILVHIERSTLIWIIYQYWWYCRTTSDQQVFQDLGQFWYHRFHENPCLRQRALKPMNMQSNMVTHGKVCKLCNMQHQPYWAEAQMQSLMQFKGRQQKLPHVNALKKQSNSNTDRDNFQWHYRRTPDSSILSALWCWTTFFHSK